MQARITVNWWNTPVDVSKPLSGRSLLQAVIEELKVPPIPGLQTAKRSFTFARTTAATTAKPTTAVSKPLSGRSLLQGNGKGAGNLQNCRVSKPLSGRSLLQEDGKRAN